MAGYTQQWDCRICNETQDTDGVPKYGTCYKCVERLASTLCKERLGKEIHTPGVDRQYFLLEAGRYVSVLMRRWKSKYSVTIEQPKRN